MKRRQLSFRCIPVAWLLLAVLGTITSPSIGAVNGVPIDAFFGNLHARGEFNGSVLVAEGDEVVFRGAYGLANEESRTKLEPDTPYRVASVTKGFTAVLALQAVERGEIDLDGGILAYFPEIPGNSLKTVTIRHLLTHSSGIPDFVPSPHDGETLSAALTRQLAAAKLAAEPGAQTTYANVGYTIVGVILERATKRSYAQLLDERILQPAGMTSTYLDVGPNVDRPRAVGYQDTGEAIEPDEVPDLSIYLPAGGLVSSAGDLLRFSRALASESLLSADSKALMLSPLRGQFAIGCSIRTVPNGESAQLFLGGMPGTSAVLARFNDGERTLILLSNRTGVRMSRLIPQVYSLIVNAESSSAPVVDGENIPTSTQ